MVRSGAKHDLSGNHQAKAPAETSGLPIWARSFLVSPLRLRIALTPFLRALPATDLILESDAQAVVSSWRQAAAMEFLCTRTDMDAGSMGQKKALCPFTFTLWVFSLRGKCMARQLVARMSSLARGSEGIDDGRWPGSALVSRRAPVACRELLPL